MQEMEKKASGRSETAITCRTMHQLIYNTCSPFAVKLCLVPACLCSIIALDANVHFKAWARLWKSFPSFSQKWDASRSSPLRWRRRWEPAGRGRHLLTVYVVQWALCTGGPRPRSHGRAGILSGFNIINTIVRKSMKAVMGTSPEVLNILKAPNDYSEPANGVFQAWRFSWSSLKHSCWSGFWGAANTQVLSSEALRSFWPSRSSSRTLISLVTWHNSLQHKGNDCVRIQAKPLNADGVSPSSSRLFLNTSNLK